MMMILETLVVFEGNEVAEDIGGHRGRRGGLVVNNWSILL